MFVGGSHADGQLASETIRWQVNLSIICVAACQEFVGTEPQMVDKETQ